MIPWTALLGELLWLSSGDPGATMTVFRGPRPMLSTQKARQNHVKVMTLFMWWILHYFFKSNFSFLSIYVCVCVHIDIKYVYVSVC